MFYKNSLIVFLIGLLFVFFQGVYAQQVSFEKICEKETKSFLERKKVCNTQEMWDIFQLITSHLQAIEKSLSNSKMPEFLLLISDNKIIINKTHPAYKYSVARQYAGLLLGLVNKVFSKYPDQHCLYVILATELACGNIVHRYYGNKLLELEVDFFKTQEK